MCQVKFIEGSRELLRGMCQLILGAEILKCNDFQPQTGSQSSQRDSKNSQNQFHYLVSDTLAISIPIPPPLSSNVLPSPVLLYSLPSQCYYKLPRDIPKWLGKGKEQQQKYIIEVLLTEGHQMQHAALDLYLLLHASPLD